MSDIIYIGDTIIDSEFAKEEELNIFMLHMVMEKNKYDDDVTSLKKLHYHITNMKLKLKYFYLKKYQRQVIIL